MAIARVNEPTPSGPLTLATGYQRQNTKSEAQVQSFTDRAIVDGSTIHGGAVFPIGGILYKATSDTTITGAASLYVKITPSLDGSTASASFVANVTGVTWNHTYGGYYDGGSPDSLYLFDEALAVSRGIISSRKTNMGAVPSIVIDHRITQGVARTETMNALEVGQTALVQWALQITSGGSGTCYLQLPASGTYHVSLTTRQNLTNNTAITVGTPLLGSSAGSVAGGSTFGYDLTANGSAVVFFGFVRRLT